MKNYVDVAALLDAHGVEHRYWAKNGKNLLYIQNADELRHRIQYSASRYSETELLAALEMENEHASQIENYIMEDIYEGGRLWIDLHDGSVHSKNYMTTDITIVERWLADLLEKADLPDRKIETQTVSRHFTYDFLLTGYPDDQAQAIKIIKNNMMRLNKEIRAAQLCKDKETVLKLELRRLFYLQLEDAKLYIDHPDMSYISAVTDQLFDDINKKMQHPE